MPTSLQKYSEEFIDLILSKYMKSFAKVYPTKLNNKQVSERKDQEIMNQENEETKKEEAKNQGKLIKSFLLIILVNNPFRKLGRWRRSS